VITDAAGNTVKRITAPYKKGIHRVNWDLSTASKRGIQLEGRDGPTPWWMRGAQVTPGVYTATLVKDAAGSLETLGEPQTFQVKSIIKGALPTQDAASIAAYRAEVEDFRGAMSSLGSHMSTSENKLKAMKKALMRSNTVDRDLAAALHSTSKEVRALRLRMSGDPNKDEIGERNNPTLNSFFGTARRGTMSSYGPTEMHRQGFANLEQQLMKIGAPYIEGQPLRVIGGE